MMKSRQIPDEVFEVFGLVSLAAPDRTSLAHRLSKLMSSAQTLDLLRFQISEDLFQRFEVESEFSACESGHHATSQGQAVAERSPQWIDRRVRCLTSRSIETDDSIACVCVCPAVRFLSQMRVFCRVILRRNDAIRIRCTCISPRWFRARSRMRSWSAADNSWNMHRIAELSRVRADAATLRRHSGNLMRTSVAEQVTVPPARTNAMRCTSAAGPAARASRARFDRRTTR
jgi:hypothetical protein